MNHNSELAKLRKEVAALLSRVEDSEQAVKSLSLSRDRYRALTEMSSDLSFEFRIEEDGRHCWTILSGDVESITGYSNEALNDCGGWKKLIFPDDRTKADAHFQRVFGGHTDVCELRIVAKDLGIRWHRSMAYPLFDPQDGSVCGIFGMVQDLTNLRYSEVALKESKNRYKTLLEQLPVGVYRTTPEGRFVEANGATASLFGFDSPDDLQHINVKEFYLDLSDREHHLNRLSEESTHTADLRLRKASGDVIWVRDYSRAVRDDGGNICYFDGMIVDITDRQIAQKALRESEGRLAQAQSIARIGNWEWDIFTDRLFWSEEMYRVFGLEPGDIEPSFDSWLDLVHSEDLASVQWTTETLRTEGRHVPFEYRIIRPDGTICWVWAEGVLALDEAGKPTRMVGTLQDITERKLFEHQLIVARENAEEMSRLKSAFLNNMSHEIRTPLTAIIGFSGILAEEVSGEHEELAELIEQCGNRLLNTLNSVLDLSMLEAGSFTLEKAQCNLLELVRDKIDQIRPAAFEKGLDVQFESDAPQMVANIDRTCIDRVLSHLLDNAIKFTDKGTVSISVATRGKDIHIRVTDTGVGISEDFLPHLFDEFKQESAGIRRSYEGAGLGLAVTKRMLVLMNGQIQVESTKDVGSSFEIVLPNTLEAYESNGVQLNGYHLEHDRILPSILIVEDSAEIEVLLGHMLGNDFDVSTARNEEGALSLARQRTYDVVLMDINLGGARTGVDVLSVLRQLPDYSDVPVVAMTAYALLEDREHFLDVGFNAYLSKPFTSEQLQEVVKRMLKLDVKNDSWL